MSGLPNSNTGDFLSMQFRLIRSASLVAIVWLASGGVLSAQTSLGTIVGTVTDDSGAAIPNVAVQITNEGTAAVRQAMTDAWEITHFPRYRPAFTPRRQS